MSDIRTPTEAPALSRAVPSPSLVHLHANFRKTVHSGGHEFLLDVDFEVPTGFTILFGASGAGKTTLLDCLAGLAVPDSGRIALDHRVLFDSSLHLNVSTAQRRVGYVFQSLALFPHMTVEQNVGYGLPHLPKSERAGRVEAMLQAFHISGLLRRKAHDI